MYLFGLIALFFSVVSLPCISLKEIQPRIHCDRFGNWIWTNSHEDYSVQPNTDPTPETTTAVSVDEKIAEEDPCAPYKPVVPDFSSPNRRKSVIKCYDYIWNIKYRKEKAIRDKACYDSSFHITVIGGRKALPGEFPHMAAIGWLAAEGSWVFKCGGTLISPKFVLTAAHCTSTTSFDTSVSDPVPKIVRLGNENIDDDDSDEKEKIKPIDVNILKIIKHPKHKGPLKYNDIALIELVEAIEFSDRVHPACLWTDADEKSINRRAIVTGWGVVDISSRKTSPTLQAADIEMVDKQNCDDLLRENCNKKFCGLDNNQICAGHLSGGIDSCQGDSGGPLQVEIKIPMNTTEKMYHVIGVTSFGFGCARKNTPGVYTKVAGFMDWIESIVWP